MIYKKEPYLPYTLARDNEQNFKRCTIIANLTASSKEH